MSNEGDIVASAVLEEFAKLPVKRRPCIRDNGLHEWVPLAGIVAKGPGFLKCVALATGMKCLPASKLPQANGVAIHDWHAEVLAIRAFNYFILEECRRLSLNNKEASSEFLLRGTEEELASQQSQNEATPWRGQPFAWREDVTLHMYCSEAPCGDASMELIMAAQVDASPWDIPPPLAETNDQPTSHSATTETVTLPGRAFFSQLGIVRRKPSRSDAPQSLSKSCSDKLALKQCTSLLSSLPSLFVCPRSVYLTSLILPESQFSPAACHRCFSASSSSPSSSPSSPTFREKQKEGRMKPLLDHYTTTKLTDNTGPYSFTPFSIRTTILEFGFSKRTAVAASTSPRNTTTNPSDNSNIVASNLAVAWSANGLDEGLVGGVLQGRKQFVPKGASSVSRRKLWEMAIQVAGQLPPDMVGREILGKALDAGRTYDDVKGCDLLADRRRVKDDARREALKGWIRNTGDGSFSI
ncbi:adenosine deaminase/editase [Apodospora peruviana]|uniref:Adenosine deaminase/editase n=1 Tax=Apodospora peruviana TaxID=516989 RepID=A0AAE0IT28_9PEZI|nr:adenosine deaminase/editase [Apodospora peruviana]